MNAYSNTAAQAHNRRNKPTAITSLVKINYNMTDKQRKAPFGGAINTGLQWHP